jgi:hypothetical protein
MEDHNDSLLWQTVNGHADIFEAKNDNLISKLTFAAYQSMR